MKLNKTQQAIRVKFLDGLKAISTAEASLKAVVEKAAKAKIERSTLVEWGVEAGYSEGHVRSVISRVMCELGERQNAKGQGRETSKEALALAEAIISKVGDKKAAKKLLLAAYRAIK